MSTGLTTQIEVDARVNVLTARTDNATRLDDSLLTAPPNLAESCFRAIKISLIRRSWSTWHSLCSKSLLDFRCNLGQAFCLLCCQTFSTLSCHFINKSGNHVGRRNAVARQSCDCVIDF